MTDTELSYQGKVRAKPYQPVIRTPRNPEKVKLVIRLRDEEKLSWRQIAAQINSTGMAPFILYKRWYQWAKDH